MLGLVGAPVLAMAAVALFIAGLWPLGIIAALLSLLAALWPLLMIVTIVRGGIAAAKSGRMMDVHSDL